MKEKTNVPKSAAFDISIADGVANVKRQFVFDGAKIDFDIAVSVKGEQESVTVAELHQRSVRKVIALLEGLVPPEK